MLSVFNAKCHAECCFEKCHSECCHEKCHYAEILIVIILSGVMQSFMPRVVKYSATLMSVFMQSHRADFSFKCPYA
jgi:hypothetical protein